MSDKDIVLYERGKSLPVKKQEDIVIYDEGKSLPIKKREDLELMQLVMLDDMLVELKHATALSRGIKESIEKEEFEGKTDDRTLNATDQLQWIDLIDRFPNTPWATAFFFNDGPVNRVYITINDVYPTVPLNRGESDRKDFTKADKRIGLIYYWCDAGNTASVRARGKY